MPALVYAYPEAEGAVREWARALGLQYVDPTTGPRAVGFFFGIPVTKPVFPLGVLTRVAGRPVRGVPWDRPVIQFDLLGDAPPERRPPSDKYALSVIATALVSAAESLAAGSLIAAGVVCMGAEVENGPVWSPSPVDGRSRYTVDIAFVLRAA